MKKKVTYTFYVDSTDSADVEQLSIPRKIHIARIAKGQTCTQWANELGVSPSFIHQIITGVRKTQYIRDYIEQKLETPIWTTGEREAH